MSSMDDIGPAGDLRRDSPAAERNKDPIAAVLARQLPCEGLVLEIASGTGQHALHFARRFPSLAWQPTDPDEWNRASIDAWAHGAGLCNLRAALDLDVHRRPWPAAMAAAVICINMIHIAPWSATPALCAGAAEQLPPGGLLYLYGPYRVGGRHTAPGNEEFDVALRARDPAWGVRDLETVVDVARRAGFALQETVAMPANNLSVVLRRTAG
jgi:hypothetical protein